MAEIVAVAGALGVAGFRVDIDPARFAYTVLGLSMVAVVALVYRLGGGLHGLGRSGVLLFGAALVLLVVGLAYTAALTRWGSPELRLDVESATGLDARPPGRRTPSAAGAARHPRPRLGRDRA